MDYANELGVDVSQGEDISDETLQEWREAGVKHVYVQYSSKLPYYLYRLDGQGFTVDCYVYLYFPLSPWGQTPLSRVETALAMCIGHAVRCVWLDVEDPHDSASPADTVAALWGCVAAVEAAGHEAGIYTGYYTWKSHTDDSEAFARLRLWHADYIGTAPAPDLALRPTSLYFRTGAYFGKTAPDVWQWWNTTTFGGHSVDMDVEAPTEERDMHFVLPRLGLAEWWTNRELSHDEEPTFMDALVDFGAQPGDVVRFLVNVETGTITFYHGTTRAVAGVCHAGTTVVEAQVAPDGRIGFETDRVKVTSLFGLGLWR